MSANANLHKAKDAKNDEFYTQLTDVSKELMHYKQHFKDKIVLCNCDDPTWSAFWKYFHLNFEALGLKKLISTHYDKTEPTYKMEYTGGNDNDIEVGVKTPLEGNGDFRNQECLDLLDEADIVVTNPPFSRFVTNDNGYGYVNTLLDYDKKFLIIGNKNAITYKEFFPLLKNDDVWIGYESPSEFDTPMGMTKKVQGLCRWFTNLDIQKRHEKLILWKNYSPEEYPTYDNYDAINVDKVDQIPCDYDGVVGVPITFLDKYNPEQFEILGISKTWATDFEIDKKKVYTSAHQHNKDGSIVSGSKINDGGAIALSQKPQGIYYTDDNNDGKYLVQVYARIFIRRKAGI